MKGSTVRHSEIEGHPALILGNTEILLTILPTLGARVLSARSQRTGCEWLWRPRDGRKLQPAPSGASFDAGPMAGLDDCIPTISPCKVNEISLPDHGEAWNRSWEATLHPDAVETAIQLRYSSLEFRRKITLNGNVVRFGYSLTNHAESDARYLWAQHPLFSIDRLDEIQIPGSPELTVYAAAGGELAPGDRGIWPQPRAGTHLGHKVLGGSGLSYCKAFFSTLHSPWIRLIDHRRNECLEITADTTNLGSWGYWLTLGGWKGHSHCAIEASNAATDRLDQITDRNEQTTIRAKQTKNWWVNWTLGAAP